MPCKAISRDAPPIYKGIVGILVGDLKSIRAADAAPRRRESAAETIRPISDNLIGFWLGLFASSSEDQVGRILILGIGDCAAHSLDSQHSILHDAVGVHG